MTPGRKSIAGTLWIATIVAGMILLTRRQGTPGQAAAAALSWPESAGLARSTDRPMLLMFLHPHCACSDASLAELSRILTAAPGRADVRLIFFSPDSAGTGWTQTSLHAAAQRIPNVTVMDDANGALARQFGVVTSGQVLLYSAKGRLLFNGGITAARAHEGDNAGESIVAAMLLHADSAPAETAQTSVFGCPIIDSTKPDNEVAP